MWMWIRGFIFSGDIWKLKGKGAGFTTIVKKTGSSKYIKNLTLAKKSLKKSSVTS